MKRLVTYGLAAAFVFFSAGSQKRAWAHTPSQAPAADCESNNGGSQPASETEDSDGDGVADGKDPAPFDKGRSKPCAGANTPGSRPITIPIEYSFSDKPYGTNVRYDMTARTNPQTGKTTYTANLKVNLTGDRNATREAQWQKCVQDFWKNGDVEVKIDFVSSGGYQTVKINPGDGRSNAGEWFAGSPTFDCNVVNHEVAHLMGLPDEYCDSRDPNRWIGEKDSIMRVVWKDAAGKGPRTYPRMFDRMIADYQCPPKTGQESFDKQKPGFWERMWDRVVGSVGNAADTLGRAAVASRYGRPIGVMPPMGPDAGTNVGRFADTRGGGPGAGTSLVVPGREAAGLKRD